MPPRTPRLPTGPPKRTGGETATVKAILQFLALHHIPAWRINTGATKIEGRFLRFGAVGMADIIGIIEYSDPGSWATTGRFLAIETKSATERVTPQQEAFLRVVNEAGGLGFVARSVNDVKERLGLP